MTSDQARSLRNREAALDDIRMAAWNSIVEDPLYSEEGRRQYATFKRATRDYWAAMKRVERAKKRHPHYFAAFAAAW